MALSAPRTIIGLVDAGGSGGGSVGATDQWSLIFHLAGWRHAGSAVIIGTRRCEMAIPEPELHEWMSRVGPYSIVEAEIDENSTAELTKLRRIVRTGASDPELEELAARLQAPILLHDPILGRLEYSRRFSEFAGRADWCGREVKISLQCALPDDSAVVLEVAARLFSDQAGWDRRVRQYAAQQLLPLKNNAWLNEDEAEMSASEFLSKMTLDTISIDEAGDFSFWHDDGDLFWGHSILVSGSLSEGPTDADIPG